MGDRANVIFASDSTETAKTLEEALAGNIVLYTHWGGYDLGPALARALKQAKPRWTDSAYGTRILVSQIIGSNWGRETGYGLCVGELCDNERPVLLVDFAQSKVRCFREGATDWTFEEFSGMSDQAAREAHLGAGYGE